MTLLALHHAPARSVSGAAAAAQSSGRARPAEPLLLSDDPALIQAELGRRGIRFERWPASATLPAAAGDAEILSAYAGEIARVQEGGRYRTVDAIRLGPGHPDHEVLRRKFLAEHIHDDDEVRFFVEGCGLFCLHLGDEVLQVLCGRGDWIAVPAGTRHWFDMGARPSFCALRFFDDERGWVPRFTGDAIAERFPLLDELLSTANS